MKRTIDVGELQDRVARKAYEFFEIRGGEHGHDVDQWLEAERLVMGQIRQQESGK